ncbi:DUF6653 family protein [Halovivax gelatinilyticus]|uniref:DUF6653 family protein n=1 Tax=Halovivax gelatinilyticus TaxID=2961597 RepID=UPI0020CA66A6|nr:DUF6653 family protein [Halovivax gelatinilyticus]
MDTIDSMDRFFWSRHANPASVWTFVAAYPTLVLAIYRRDRPLLAGILLFVVINPLVSSPPKRDDAWATRVVLGERVWLEQGILSSKETLFTAACAPVFLYTIRSASRRDPVRTVGGTVASMVLMFVFFGRMVSLYETESGLRDAPTSN